MSPKFVKYFRDAEHLTSWGWMGVEIKLTRGRDYLNLFQMFNFWQPLFLRWRDPQQWTSVPSTICLLWLLALGNNLRMHPEIKEIWILIHDNQNPVCDSTLLRKVQPIWSSIFRNHKYLISNICQARRFFWQMIHHTCGKLQHGG